MPTRESSRSRSRFLGPCCVLALLLAGCPDPEGPGGPLDFFVNSIVWKYVNNGNENVSFGGSNAEGHPLPQSVDLDPGCSSRDSTTGRTETASVHGEVRMIGPTGTQLVRPFKGVVPDGRVLAVTAIWSGSDLSVTASLQELSPAGTADPGSQANVAVKTCPSWKLEGITGAVEGSYESNLFTATGSVAISFPETVNSGDAVPLSASFSGRLTFKGTAFGTEGIFISLSGTGLQPQQQLVSLGTAAPGGTLSGEVSTARTWTVPFVAGVNAKLTVGVTGGFQTFGTLVVGRTATYSKCPADPAAPC